jgi:hypothetical protein
VNLKHVLGQIESNSRNRASHAGSGPGNQRYLRSLGLKGNDGVDDAYTASGLMRAVPEWLSLEQPFEGRSYGASGGVWHHRLWVKVMEVSHAPS